MKGVMACKIRLHRLLAITSTLLDMIIGFTHVNIYSSNKWMTYKSGNDSKEVLVGLMEICNSTLTSYDCDDLQDTDGFVMNCECFVFGADFVLKIK